MNKEIKTKALISLKGQWKSMWIIGFIAFLLSTATPSIVFLLFVGNDYVELLNNPQIINEDMAPEDALSFLSTTLQGFALTILLIFLLLPFWTSFRWITLDLIRGKSVTQNDLLNNLKPNYQRLFIFNLLYTIFIFLWSMLFVIPGIIKMLSYALAPFLLKDNPEMTGIEAITRSKQLMEGRKMRLFSLAISFIGWFILLSLANNNVNGLMELILPGAENLIISWVIGTFISSALNTVFYVYFFSALSVFYDNVLEEEGEQTHQQTNSVNERTNSIIL